LLESIAARDSQHQQAVTEQALQAVYDNVENCFELCTKRTERKPAGEGWESHLDPDDVASLIVLRTDVSSAAAALSPSSSDVDFQRYSELRRALESKTNELRRKAVQRIAEKERREARQHAATWKLLASFNQKRVQPEVPPSRVYEHYKNISQIPGAPLSVNKPPALFIGPLNKDDFELESDITANKTKTALETINTHSAPGPDGLPPRLITRIFSSTLLVAFLSQFLTWCFRAVWVPAQWRTSENFILYKGGGPTDDVSSFRAISLTQIFAKVPGFEDLVYFYSHLTPT
jgi:hypothetical protein